MADVVRFSVREWQVFVALSEGHTAKAIALAMQLSYKTVVAHKYNMAQKAKRIGYASLADAVAARNSGDFDDASHRPLSTRPARAHP